MERCAARARGSAGADEVERAAGEGDAAETGAARALGSAGACEVGGAGGAEGASGTTVTGAALALGTAGAGVADSAGDAEGADGAPEGRGAARARAREARGSTRARARVTAAPTASGSARAAGVWRWRKASRATRACAAIARTSGEGGAVQGAAGSCGGARARAAAGEPRGACSRGRRERPSAGLDAPGMETTETGSASSKKMESSCRPILCERTARSSSRAATNHATFTWSQSQMMQPAPRSTG